MRVNVDSGVLCAAVCAGLPRRGVQVHRRREMGAERRSSIVPVGSRRRHQRGGPGLDPIHSSRAVVDDQAHSLAHLQLGLKAVNTHMLPRRYRFEKFHIVVGRKLTCY